MKRFKYSNYVSILLCFCFTPMRAQEKEPVCSWVGAVWSYCDYDNEKYSFVRYTVLDRPEVIDGLTYYPLVKYTTCEYEEGKEKATYRIRQEGDKVYMRKDDVDQSEYSTKIVFKGEGNDYIFYDFSLDINEEFCQTHFVEKGDILYRDTTIVFKVDTIQTSNNQSFKRTAIRRKDREIYYFVGIWIGGIGSTYDLLVPYGYYAVDCSCYQTLNYFCSADNSVVYRNPRIKDVNDPQFKFYLDNSHYDHFKEDDCALPSNISDVTNVCLILI